MSDRQEESAASQLDARAAAVDELVNILDRQVTIGSLEWSAVEDDYRLLAINVAFRRQLEGISAAVLLAKHDLALALQ